MPRTKQPRLSWPRGHFAAYYFQCRRQGRTPRQAWNCVQSHAAAKEIVLADSEHLRAFYDRPGVYSGD